MDASVLKGLLGLLIALVILASAIGLYRPRRTSGTLMLIFGASCFVVVAMNHLFEAQRILPMLRWGEPHGVGHYLNLTAAVLGVVFVVWGLLLQGFWWLQSRASWRGGTPSNNHSRGA